MVDHDDMVRLECESQSEKLGNLYTARKGGDTETFDPKETDLSRRIEVDGLWITGVPGSLLPGRNSFTRDK